MKHIIIGNGPAGVVAAETIRKADARADITMIGDEPEPPYSRMALPYLLQGDIEEDGTYLRKGAGHFERLRIRTIGGYVEGVVTRAKEVRLRDGTTLAYDRLLIASGAHPTRPPVAGVDLPAVQTCWTLADARAIAARAKPGSRVLQIGAGFIGCIILEALASRGVHLTVVEMGDRMVPRMMTPIAGGMIRAWCEKKGVRVHTKARVMSIRPDMDRAGSVFVKLDSGDELPADLVISAAGVKPNVAFLAGSHVATDQGVLVDDRLRTNVPDIYAAGDVAESVDFSTGERGINAIQPNAVDQGRVAALNMVGRETHFVGALAINVLQTLGLISSSFGKWWGDIDGQGAETVDRENFRYLSLQFKDDVLIGATSIGLTEHVGVLRGLIQSRRQLGPWKDELLHDPTRIMQASLAAAVAVGAQPPAAVLRTAR
ncbi:MAG: NAD(P)/FAD-dependent oxidoreductase [Betaproteobacteria bacterium]|nr:NAD(P)/FAD-dependent oxidoreductase [Betaproteobacteria bacterium]